MMEKLRMWSMRSALAVRAAVKTAKPFQRKLVSRCDTKGRRPVLKLKKRHVEMLTRLPTKRMATACWAFIVAKSTLPEPAPMLVFLSLSYSNRRLYAQDINSLLKGMRALTHEDLVQSEHDSKAQLVRSILAAQLFNRSVHLERELTPISAGAPREQN
jgi:hypothetical protein